MDPNTIHLSRKSSDLLDEIFSAKQPKDRCRMVVEFDVVDIDPDNVFGKIKRIEPLDYGGRPHDSPMVEEPAEPASKMNGSRYGDEEEMALGGAIEVVMKRENE